MTAAEARRREQIIQAAARLTGEGLIARTWGNISARLSETQFLITPSGLAYETMEPDQLVPVSIPDAAWTGPIKPSSERGIHADAYRLRPEVQFIIHTHQYYASVAGIEGRALTGFIDPLLGKRAPCAAYGLPGTARLRRAVEAACCAATGPCAWAGIRRTPSPPPAPWRRSPEPASWTGWRRTAPSPSRRTWGSAAGRGTPFCSPGGAGAGSTP